MDRSGYGENVASLFARQPGGDQRPAALRCFDHQTAERQARNDPVAPREVLLERRRAEGELADDDAIIGDALRQFAVPRRVNPVAAGTDDGNRRAAAGKTAAMRGGIDAERQATDDGEARLRQRSRKRFGVGVALRRRVAAADDGDARPVEQLRAPLDVKKRRRIGGVEQAPRVFGVGQREDAVLRRLRPRQRCFNRLGGIMGQQAFRGGTRDVA